MERYLIPVSQTAVEHGFKIGWKVYQDKQNFRSKWIASASKELQADVSGFIAESVICEHTGHLLPQLTTQKIDDYDLLINGFKVDVKKVTYSRFSSKTKITLNKKQFDRKNKKIDIFLFCNFEGSFTSKSVGAMNIFVPIPTTGKLWLIGWIKSEDVTRLATIHIWQDQDGNEIDKGYRLLEKDLRPISELLEA